MTNREIGRATITRWLELAPEPPIVRERSEARQRADERAMGGADERAPFVLGPNLAAELKSRGWTDAMLLELASGAMKAPGPPAAPPAPLAVAPATPPPEVDEYDWQMAAAGDDQ